MTFIGSEPAHIYIISTFKITNGPNNLSKGLCPLGSRFGIKVLSAQVNLVVDVFIK